MKRIDELLGRRVELRSFSILRVLVGPIVVWHLWPFLADSGRGRTYRDAYWQPYADWLPVLPTPIYVALLWVGAAAAVTMSIGWHPQAATRVTAAVVVINMLVSTTHFHNNRAFLAIVLAALAIGPCGPDAVGPAWPLWLLRFEVSCVYLGSGMSKLLDRDWFGGTVTWSRVTQVRDQLARSPLPTWMVDALTERDVHTVAAKAIVATEFFIGLGLWFPATRRYAVVVAVAFHVAIQFSAQVEVFSVLAIVALVIWRRPGRADPADGVAAGGSVAGGAVSAPAQRPAIGT